VRVVFVGGTNFVGPVAVGLLWEAGHEVAVAHSGAHEPNDQGQVEHLHGSRDALLAPGGPVESWHPDALVDTFAGGATAAKARQLADCAQRGQAGHMVVISSMDVYQHCVDSGLADGGGFRVLSFDPIPLGEESRLRSGPYPGGSPAHDNVAMEAALHEAGKVTALRPGAIYGPHPSTRERTLVEKIARGEHELPLPAGGVQIWHRVAVARVARAIVAALNHDPDGFWACNVVDPYDWDYAGLAAQVAGILDWKWTPVDVAFHETDHPWQVGHPVLCSEERLRHVLGVTEPEPRAALRETVTWLWEHRDELS
jgi:nucleoside-diphosphate-sugar epimerase